jgi:hypothetical protein
MAVVIPIASLTTYAIVLNLERLLRLLLPLRMGRPGSTHPASFSLAQHFIQSQSQAMRQHRSKLWRQRGKDLERQKTSDHGQPSQWRTVQFALLRLGLAIWGGFQFILCCLQHKLPTSRSNPHLDPFAQQHSLGDLGDVHVKVHVDIDVEDA